MNNQTLRKGMIEQGFKQYEVAKLLGVSVNTLVKRMREEMPIHEQERIIELMKKANEEKQKGK